MSKRDDIRSLLEERIRTGEYAVGSRLPGIRSLATDLDAHPNTVAEAYRVLGGTGTVRLVQGRGTFVLRVPAPPSTQAQRNGLQQQARSLVSRARAFGMSEDEVLSLVRSATAEAYAQNTARVTFVECNPFDTEELAHHVGNLLQVPVEPLLVQDLLASPADFLPCTDLFVTTPFHIDEVESALDSESQVITVNVAPVAATLVELSRIPHGLRIAAVATNERTLKRLSRMISLHARSQPAIQSIVSEADLKTRLRAADVIVGTQAIEDALANVAAGRRQITVHYQLEANSAEFLVERFKDLFPGHEIAALDAASRS